MTTFTFTVEQVRQVFEAGIRRGNEEATAFDWGTSVGGNKFDELVDTLVDVFNDGKNFGDEGYVTWKEVEELVQE